MKFEYIGCILLVGVLSLHGGVATAQVVFTAGDEFENGSFVGSLNEFEIDGMLVERTPSPTDSFFSLATDGSRILAGSGLSLVEFDLFGNRLGVFANVPEGGPNSMTALLETDEAGSVYVSFAGFQSAPRTSFRLNSSGIITQTFSNPGLVFPVGIDADADGTTWILNGAAVGVGNRLFAFSPNGVLQNEFALPEVDNATSIAISETLEELYISDFAGDALHVYDISSGSPIFSQSIATPTRPTGIFIEPNTDRIFGTSFFEGGFEVDRNGNLLNEYVFGGQPGSTSDIVAFVPEPGSGTLMVIGGLAALASRRRR